VDGRHPLRQLKRRKSKKGPDRTQAKIAGSGANTIPLCLQIKKRTDQWRINIFPCQR